MPESRAGKWGQGQYKIFRTSAPSVGTWHERADEWTHSSVLPKGQRFTLLTSDDIARVVWRLNHRPRKILHSRTPVRSVRGVLQLKLELKLSLIPRFRRVANHSDQRRCRDFAYPHYLLFSSKRTWYDYSGKKTILE